MVLRKSKVALVALASCSLTACGAPSPSAQVDEWAITRKQDGTGYAVKLRGAVWGEGSWFVHLDYIDHNGCARGESFGGIFPNGGKADINKTFDLPSKPQLQRATLSLNYVAKGDSPMNAGSYNKMFAEERAVDPLPAGAKLSGCPKIEEKLEASVRPSSREEDLATVINLDGYLCGKVLNTYSGGPGKIIVHCTLYRDGRGRAKYSIDRSTAMVTQVE